MLAEEEWKPIKGYEGLYSVSNLGRVRREACVITSKVGKKQSFEERILKPWRCSNEYLAISLCKGNKVTKKLMHRLVASAFLDNPDSLPEVNHIDHDRTNNALSNLEWCTKSANRQHCHKHNRKAAKQKLTVEEVEYIASNAKTGRGKDSGNNIKQLAEMFGIHVSTIYDILRGSSWSYI